VIRLCLLLIALHRLFIAAQLSTLGDLLDMQHNNGA